MRGLLLVGLMLLHTLHVGGDVCSEEVLRLRAKERELEEQLQRQRSVIHKLKQRSYSSPGDTKGDTPDSQYRDCSEVFGAGLRSSGWFRIWPLSSQAPLRVYCDASGGEGWTVIQRRSDGSQSFNRSWEEYKNGFGDFESDSGEFWLGNDHLHALTAQGNYSLRINLMDFEGKRRYAEYKDFRVGDEQALFQLSFGDYVGTAGDALSGMYEVGVVSWAGHQGANFSTFDRDNDNYGGNCAQEDQGGWWFNKCHSAHLNGRYYPGGFYSAWSDNGVVWFPWRGWWYSLKATVMEIRPRGFKMADADDPNAVHHKPTS